MQVQSYYLPNTSNTKSLTERSHIIWYIAGFFEGILVIRLILTLMPRNFWSRAVGLFNSITYPLERPFAGFGDGTLPTPVAIGMAMLAFALIAWGLSKVLSSKNRRSQITIDRV